MSKTYHWTMWKTLLFCSVLELLFYRRIHFGSCCQIVKFAQWNGPLLHGVLVWLLVLMELKWILSSIKFVLCQEIVKKVSRRRLKGVVVFLALVPDSSLFYTFFFLFFSPLPKQTSQPFSSHRTCQRQFKNASVIHCKTFMAVIRVNCRFVHIKSWQSICQNS